MFRCSCAKPRLVSLQAAIDRHTNMSSIAAINASSTCVCRGILAAEIGCIRLQQQQQQREEKRKQNLEPQCSRIPRISAASWSSDAFGVVCRGTFVSRSCAPWLRVIVSATLLYTVNQIKSLPSSSSSRRRAASFRRSCVSLSGVRRDGICSTPTLLMLVLLAFVSLAVPPHSCAVDSSLYTSTQHTHAHRMRTTETCIWFDCADTPSFSCINHCTAFASEPFVRGLFDRYVRLRCAPPFFVRRLTHKSRFVYARILPRPSLRILSVESVRYTTSEHTFKRFAFRFWRCSLCTAFSCWPYKADGMDMHSCYCGNMCDTNNRTYPQ